MASSTRCSRRPELVAKVQKQPLSQTDIAKLEALIRGATPELLSVAAWPMDGLKSITGRVVGFVMPRILDARPLYELYSPRSRVQHFPSADFRFLVHVAANVARLFAAVHKAGFICGDVNHSNILVRQSGTVAAVDCDSFQVGDGSRFPCLVGTDLFVPPELMGTALSAGRRTANHDAFGLAVLVFHLLFMGRHPFAGRFLGKGEMPIERAIAECRFAYSTEARRTEMAPPPFTPPMEVVGRDVMELFERAFHPDERSGGRPTPQQWIDALDSLKAGLVSCKTVAWHHHPAGDGHLSLVRHRRIGAHKVVWRTCQNHNLRHCRSRHVVGPLLGACRTSSAAATAQSGALETQASAQAKSTVGLIADPFRQGHRRRRTGPLRDLMFQRADVGHWRANGVVS